MTLSSPSTFQPFVTRLALDVTQLLTAEQPTVVRKVVFKHFTHLPDRVAGEWQLETQTPPLRMWQENPGCKVGVACFVGRNADGAPFDILWLQCPSKLSAYGNSFYFHAKALQNELYDALVQFVRMAVTNEQELEELHQLARIVPQVTFEPLVS